MVPSTTYRRNLKENTPKKYEEYLLQQKIRSKNYRDKVKSDPDKQKLVKLKAKERQKKYREKLKLKTDESVNKIPDQEIPNLKPQLQVHTRSETQQRRKKWREAKKKYRQNLSAHKKLWVRRKDKMRKREKKIQELNLQVNTNADKQKKGYKSKKTLYNVTSKARKSLPESPHKFALVINNLVKNATPRKREAVGSTLLETTLTCPVKKLKIMEPVQETPETSYVHVEKSETCSRSSKAGRGFNTARRCPYYRPLPKTNSLVKNFYFRENISTPLPQKRYANKHGPGYVMQTTLMGAFSLFRKEFKQIKIGFTKFTQMRPKNVRLLTNRHWNYCVCTVCQNISYKLKAISRCIPGKAGDFEQLLNVVLCTKNDGQRFHFPGCIYRTCEKCTNSTVSKLTSYFYGPKSLKNKPLPRNDLVTWNHWEKEKVEGNMRRVLKSKRESVSTMLEELASDIDAPVQSTSFSEHLFVGQWQQRQFSELKRNLPQDSILLVMDFGKNRSVRYQDEPKSVFFTARQITIHPVVMFYHSPSVQHLIVRSSLIFLTDDTTHDYHAVDHFLEKSVQHLKETAIPFSKLIVFSDGCAAQYKGKGSFADLSLKNIQIERNYFGSDHGKSECDGELGCINRAVDMAILGRHACITDAEDMYAWCSKSNLCLDEAGSKRRFFLVDKRDINRDRGQTNITTLQGCRKLHQIVNIPSSPYELMVKKLSCYCENCRNGKTKDCPNKEYTGEYQHKILKRSTVGNSSRSDVSATVIPCKSTLSLPKTPTVSQKSGTELWEKLTSCQTYDDLQQIIVETKLPTLPPLPDVTFVSHKRVIDESALGLMPEEQKDSCLFPSIVYGDGNCLPRCASLFVYGHEENHYEMRARIIEELVRNEEIYLDDKYLKKGSHPCAHKNVAIQFAMFSEHYTAEKLTNLAIQRIFRAEVLGICSSGKYMGMWQIAALANILQTVVVSVYPLYGGRTVRNDCHRKFLPHTSSKIDINAKEVYIMWSNVHGTKLPEKDWHPNHFVPLLRTNVLSAESDDEEALSPIYDFDEDAQDSFMDSSLVHTILEGLDDTPDEVRLFFECLFTPTLKHLQSR